MMATADGNRRTYAELVKGNKNMNPTQRGMAFKLFEHPERSHATAMVAILAYAQSATSTASKIEEARNIIKVKPW